MAKTFTTDEWRAVNAALEGDPGRYGLPERVYGSVVMASFNIRKLGSALRRNADTWAFLGRLCRRFDLLALQEVMDDVSGLERLAAEMGPEYGMIVSDKTGAFPGDAGLNERLAFIYRESVVRRGPIVSDVTYDRTKLHELLAEHWDQVEPAMGDFKEKWEEFLAGDRKRRPKVELPVFLTFIRSPFTVSFKLVGHPEADELSFMAVNAHLIYGERLADRKREFEALMEWIIHRQEDLDREERFPGLVLFGDLNLDFDDPETDIGDIERYLAKIDSKKAGEISVMFPFLARHPRHPEVFRTNARLKETFDHIGFFYRTERIPEAVRRREMGSDPRGPDYGVVNFVKLFCEALEGKEHFDQLSSAKQKAFFSKFEHSVSDHMPIWVRVPLPD